MGRTHSLRIKVRRRQRDTSALTVALVCTPIRAVSSVAALRCSVWTMRIGYHPICCRRCTSIMGVRVCWEWLKTAANSLFTMTFQKHLEAAVKLFKNSVCRVLCAVCCAPSGESYDQIAAHCGFMLWLVWHARAYGPLFFQYVR